MAKLSEKHGNRAMKNDAPRGDYLVVEIGTNYKEIANTGFLGTKAEATHARKKLLEMSSYTGDLVVMTREQYDANLLIEKSKVFGEGRIAKQYTSNPDVKAPRNWKWQKHGYTLVHVKDGDWNLDTTGKKRPESYYVTAENYGSGFGIRWATGHGDSKTHLQGTDETALRQQMVKIASMITAKPKKASTLARNRATNPMIIFWNFNNGNAMGFENKSKAVEYLKSDDIKAFIKQSKKNVVFIADGLIISDIDAHEFQEHLSVNPGQPPEHAVFERNDSPEKGQKLDQMRVLGGGDAIDGDRFSYYVVFRMIGQVDSTTTQKHVNKMIAELTKKPEGMKNTTTKKNEQIRAKNRAEGLKIGMKVKLLPMPKRMYMPGVVTDIVSPPPNHLVGKIGNVVALHENGTSIHVKFDDGKTYIMSTDSVIKVAPKKTTETKRNEQPPMKTAKAIRDYLGFKQFEKADEYSVYVNNDDQILYVIEQVDMWRATGNKEGQRYRMTYLELSQDQLDNAKGQADMKPVMEQAKLSEDQWMTLPYEERAIHALRYGLWNENYGEYDSIFEAWKGFRDRMHPTMNFKAKQGNQVPVEQQVADQSLAQDAFDWFLASAGQLYTNWFVPLSTNYDKKRKKGIYDEELALKGFRELAAGIFKEYNVKILKDSKKRTSFATKQALGKLLLDYYNEAFVNQAKGNNNKANPTRLTIEKCASVADVERFFKETCGFKYSINLHTYSVNDMDDIIEIHVVDDLDAATLTKLQGYLTTMISYTVYQLIVQKDFQKFAIQRPKISFGKVKAKPSTYRVIYDKANPSKEILKKINALRYMTGEQMIEEGTGDLFNDLFDSQ